MSRVQLALNVTDLDAAVEYYTRLLGTAPRKREPGYANFAVADPPLKLVLFEHADAPGGSLNHLGIEVETPQEVVAASERLRGEGLATLEQRGTTCCYATQDKVWTTGPDGERWEVYVVLADVPGPSATPETSAARACC